MFFQRQKDMKVDTKVSQKVHSVPGYFFMHSITVQLFLYRRNRKVFSRLKKKSSVANNEFRDVSVELKKIFLYFYGIKMKKPARCSRPKKGFILHATSLVGPGCKIS